MPRYIYLLLVTSWILLGGLAYTAAQDSEAVLKSGDRLVFREVCDLYQNGELSQAAERTVTTFTEIGEQIDEQTALAVEGIIGEGGVVRVDLNRPFQVNIFTAQLIPSEQTPFVQVTGNVRLRGEPGTARGEETVIRSAELGETFALRTNLPPVRVDGYNWLPIIIEGQAGWIAQDFVRIQNAEASVAPGKHTFAGAAMLGSGECIRKSVDYFYDDPDWILESHSTDVHDCATGIRLEGSRTIYYLNRSDYTRSDLRSECTSTPVEMNIGGLTKP